MSEITWVYVLWDESDNWGSNGKVKLHSIHASRISAEKEKKKQWMDGEFFRISEERLES